MTHFFKIWLLLESDTALSIGSGKDSLTIDKIVARNAAGYPYIPGTALAGVLRNFLSKKIPAADINSFWGFTSGSKGQGSRVVVNSAHLLGHDGNIVLEGVPEFDSGIEFYRVLNSLPERDYVRITERGTAEDGGKFDAELVYKGLRFITSIELLGTEEDKGVWTSILQTLTDPTFRIGGGTRKGYGKIRILKTTNVHLDLTQNADRDQYLKLDNSCKLPPSLEWNDAYGNDTYSNDFYKYTIRLRAKDFFLFGAGFGDDEADATYKTEKFFEWSDNKPKLVPGSYVLIPATSIKGALKHRVAYHYNRRTENFAGKKVTGRKDWRSELTAQLDVRFDSNQFESLTLEELEKLVSDIKAMPFAEVNPVPKEDKTIEENLAVKEIFGFANETSNKKQVGQRGRILLEDVYLKKTETDSEKVFDHVKIDRFSGGASDGALYQEKTISHQDSDITFIIYLHKDALKDSDIKQSWHNTLDDLCNGRLALGGRTTKGHGLFYGNYTINNNDYENPNL